jgi:VanZ family protein
MRLIGWVLSGLIVALSVVPPAFRPETRTPHNFEHFVIFAAAGFAFGLGYSRKPALIAALLALFAGAIEISQFFVPGRHARLEDFIVDCAAASTCAILAAFAAERVVEPRV